MPRNYYCDFCQCTFPDNTTNRRNHNKGTSHVNNRKLHYDWFKEPSLFLQEQLNKLPCKKFLSNGYCEFGLLCKFCHITLDPSTGQPIYPPELIEWFQLQQQELNNSITIKKVQKKTRYRLPSGWKVKDLPPSLKPPPSKHGYDWNNVGSWN